MDVTGMVIMMDTGEQISIKALLDSGCTRSCINGLFVKRHGLNAVKLPKAIPVFNADGTKNTSRKLTHTLQLKVVIGEHGEIMNFGVSNLGQSDLFLGHDWLKHHNPEINWETKIIKFTHCPGSCQREEIVTVADHFYNVLVQMNGATV